MAHSPKSVRQLLKGKPTLKRLELEISAQKALLEQIRAMLPGDLASHCVAARLREQRVVVYADSPAWATRLRFLAPQLPGLLRAVHPAVREVRVRMLIHRAPPTPIRRRARQSDEGAFIIQQSAVNTSDPDLRAALLRLSRALKTGA